MTTDRGKLLGTYVDEAFAEAVRVRAFQERCSKGEILRRALRAYLGLAQPARGSRGSEEAPREYPTRLQPVRTKLQAAQSDAEEAENP